MSFRLLLKFCLTAKTFSTAKKKREHSHIQKKKEGFYLKNNNLKKECILKYF
jgi:hypothetical protein